MDPEQLPLQPDALVGEEIFLARQPILDRDQQLVAYELLFRGSKSNRAMVQDEKLATAQVVTHAFGELSFGDVLGPYRAHINADPAFLLSEAVELLPGENVVLELAAETPADPELIQRCRQLRRKGFSFALGGVARYPDSHLPLAGEVDILKVDHQLLNNHELFLLTCHLKPLHKKLLAEKIEDRMQMEHCFDLGFQYFQGYYFARPTLLEGRKLSHAALSVLNLLNLILTDADTHVLERTFKQEPGLSINLLRLTNSCASGLAVRIASVRHAITILGRRQLQRWLQLLLYANPDGGPLSPLLQLAATRGRFMELGAERLRSRDRDLPDRAFMAGILSLLPTVIGQPMADILAPLSLPQDVHLALLERRTELGYLLSLTEKLEEDQDMDCAELLTQLPGLRPRSVSECLAQALSWANRLTQER